MKSEFSKVIGHSHKAIEEIDGTSAIAMDSDHRMLLVGTMAEGLRPVISKIDLRQVVHCELIENSDRWLALGVRWEGKPRQIVRSTAELEPNRVITDIRIRLTGRGKETADELIFFQHEGKGGERLLTPGGNLLVKERLETALKWHRQICELLAPVNLQETSPALHGSFVVQEEIISGNVDDPGRCDKCNRDNRPLRYAYFWHGVKVSETTKNMVYVKEKTTLYAVEGPVQGKICYDCIKQERRFERIRCGVISLITVLVGWGACAAVGEHLDSIGWQIIICIVGGLILLGTLLVAFESNDVLADQVLIQSREAELRKTNSTTFFTRYEYKHKTKF